jgi:hypothetical protein
LRADYAALTAARGPGEATLAHVRPKDPHRAEFAEWLAGVALDFLTIHEMGHLRHGHSGYFASHAGIPVIVEFAANQGISGLTRQALEMDADSYASLASLRACSARAEHAHRWIRSISEFEGGLEPPGLDGTIHWGQVCVLDWAFAVATMFQMFGLGVYQGSLMDGNHPPPIQRLCGNISLAAESGVFPQTPESEGRPPVYDTR